MYKINDETKELKKVLKNAGYPVKSCAHGRGTGYGWIHIIIDDYDRKIVNGKQIRQYEEIKKIAYQITNDDRQTIEFTKHHVCGECIISNCDKYHTPDMGVCGGFFNKEMAELEELRHQEYLKELEEIKNNPIGFTLYDDGETVELKNRAVNCGAYFTIPRDRYDAMILSGKTRENIFDLLAYENELEIKAEKYRQECEKTREQMGHPYIYDGYGNRDNTAGDFGDQPVKESWQVKEITITRADGPAALCNKPKYFDSFESVSSWLMRESGSFPKTGGYDKHDFKIVFVDGETYEGRLDCKHHECPDNDLNLLQHVLTFCKFYAGKMDVLPDHLTKEDYRRLMDNYGMDTTKQYADLLEKYILPAAI